MHQRARRHRHRQQEPARLDGRTARRHRYTTNQASYDLARLRVNGLISRIPGKNRSRLTSNGQRFAIFYTKLHNRLLRPLLATDQPPVPPQLRKALHTIDIHLKQALQQPDCYPTQPGNSSQLSQISRPRFARYM